MKVTSAIFGVSHRKKTYRVDMAVVKETADNTRQAVVTVEDTTGACILHESMSGRQLICQETAKNAVRKAIKKNK